MSTIQGIGTGTLVYKINASKVASHLNELGVSTTLKSVLGKPLPAVGNPAKPLVNTDGFGVLQPSVETVFAVNNANPTITLSKTSSSYELTGDTGSKSIAGINTNAVSESVVLKKGASYTLNSSFGMTNVKGSVKVEVKDSTGKLVKSLAAGVGKTSAKLTFVPPTDDTYTISLTGQPIAKTKTSPASTTNLYASYQIQVLQAPSKLPTKSGNANVDALVLGGTNGWHHAGGSIAKVSTQVIDGTLKSLENVVDHNNTIFYSFMDNAFLGTLTGKDANGATVMDAATKTAVATAFDYLSSLINVSFTEAASVADATIVFGENNQNGTSAGYANPPNQSGSHQQYLFLANDASSNDSNQNNGFAPGTYGWQTLIHEIAHAMGLKHPFNGNAGGGGTPPPYLPATTNNHRYSIMSYTSAKDSKALTTTVSGGSVSVTPRQINPSTYMTYDIAALQYLYGANTTTTSTDARLAGIQTLSISDSYKGMQSIWTPNGGIMDASSTTRKNVFDLRSGAYSSINYLGSGVEQLTAQINAGGITNSASVTAVLKNFKAQTDMAYTGKNNVSLAYGSKLTEVKGGSADDAFYVSNYSSTLSGGAGTDTVYLSGTAKDWSMSTNAVLSSKGGTFNSSVVLTNLKTNAQITVSNVEKYYFYSATASLTKT